MKLALALRELHRSERNLAVCLLHVAQRHRADAGVSHLAGDLARWSRQHVAELATVGGRYGLRMRAEPTYGSQQVARFWRAAGDRFGNRPEMGLLLLADLRKVHRKAAGVSVVWELLAQGAQAAEDGELLDLARRCHPQSLRQMRWANARLKELSPQILVS